MFQFPDIYHFPPFFTLQPVEQTRRKQLTQWADVILSYTFHHGSHQISISSPVWENKEISRKLAPDDAQKVLADMVEKGFAIWQSSDLKSCVVSGRKSGEWADILYKWSKDVFQTNKICTLYELTTGALAGSDEFKDEPADILLNALKILEKDGKVVIIEADAIDEVGIKFLG